MTGVHYALVPKAGPLRIPSDDDDDDREQQEVGLTEIYQSYAELYPNPRLVEERNERDLILQIVRTELEQQQSSSPVVPEKKSGFFGFLFGSRKVAPDVLLSKLNEEDHLIYKDITDDAIEGDLCGTLSRLEQSCIPHEAHSVARFFLSSGDLPKVVSETSAENPIIIVRAGVIAELVDNDWILSHTSDYEELKQQLGGNPLQQARATMIGLNCLSVSWGLSDGLVVFYRRAQDFGHGWEAVAMLPPSPPVLANIQDNEDVFLEQNEDGTLSSQLLRITDLVPLFVEGEEDDQAPVVTLCVSRLGGYMEIIPLDPPLWMGPILTPQNHKLPRKGRKGQHYALGRLFNILSQEPAIAALTMGEHLDDLLHVKVFRTPVGADTVWDDAAFPDSPPAEYLLAANGTKDGQSVFCFWAVSFLFSQNPEEGVSIHVGFLEQVPVGSLGSMCTFANDAIMEYWRKPRRVERRTSNKQERQQRPPAGTLSVSTPLVSLRFFLVDKHLVLSVLDLNGGVTIFDCTTLILKAAQTLSPEELEAIQEESQLMCKTILNRDAVRRLTKGNAISAMEWTPSGELVLTGTKRVHVLTVDPELETAEASFLEVSNLPRAVKLLKTEPLSLLLPQHDSSMFITCGLEISSPGLIIKRLMDASKYEEALQAAASFPDRGSVLQIVDNCNKHLWEGQRRITNLEDIPDDAYVIEQVAGLFRDDGGDDDVVVDMETCRKALEIALKRCTTVRVAAAVQLSEELDVVKAKLEAWYARAGTYCLLCRHVRTAERARVFFDRFASGPLIGLAGQFASQGDVEALTLLLFRHPKALGGIDRLSLLDSIPLSLEPSSYCHLFPFFKEGCGWFDNFVTANESDGIRKSTSLSAALEDDYGSPLFLEDENMSMLLKARDNSGETSRSHIADWFVSRSKAMQITVGAIPQLISFCDFAIRCLGRSSDDTDLQDLLSIRAFANHFGCILGRADEDSELLQTNVDDLAELPLTKLISMLLGRPTNHVEAANRFKRQVMPILAMPGVGADDDSEERIDDALSAYCLDLVTESTCTVAIRKSLGTCAAIAKASRSSIARSQRLIKNRHKSTQLFLDLTAATSAWSQTTQLLPSDSKDIIDKLWRVYECLPANLAPDEYADKELVELRDGVDNTYRLLIANDLVLSWATHGGTIEFETDGAAMAESLCNMFLKQIGIRHTTSKKKSKLLGDVTSDLNQLNTAAFEGSINLTPMIHNVLLMGLLQQGEFQLFVEVFSTSIGDLASWERMQPAVVSFVNEAMFGDEATSSSGLSFEIDKVHSAIQCQDILGSHFPQLQDTFRGMRRHLDASHFINTILCPDQTNLNPSELRELMPLDVVETVLMKNPLCILHDCNEWADPKAGRARNRELCSMLNPTGTLTAMPTLPGGAIMHLASIVGLESLPEARFVQSRIAHYAETLSFPWVSAAVTLHALIDTDSAWEGDDIRVKMAATVVSDEDYDDVVVKIILCRETIRCAVDPSNYWYGVILNSFGSLENRTSRFCPESWKEGDAGSTDAESSGNSEFLVFRAAGMLANTAGAVVNEEAEKGGVASLLNRELKPRPIDRVFQSSLGGYSTDLNELFGILQTKASVADGDDPLLLALGRLHVFWCISDSTQIVEHDNQGTFAQADAFENLALSASLLLHTHDKDAIVANMVEFKEIAESQALQAIEQASAHANLPPIRPDLGIVRKLMEMGYTENGARRAAVMTQNASIQAAMVWAVAHEVEPNFNSPLLFIKRQRDPQVDQTAIRNVKQCLYAIEAYFVGSKSLQSLVPSVSGNASAVSIVAAPSRPTPIERQALPVPPTAPKPAAKLSTVPSVTSPPLSQRTRSKLKIPPKEVKAAAPPVPPPPPPKPVEKQQPPPPPPKAEEKVGSRPPAPPSTGPPSRPPIIPPAPSSAPPAFDRSSLRQKGEFVRKSSRGLSNKLDHGERKRLLAKGRALLRVARSGSNLSTGSGHAARPPLPPPPPRPVPKVAIQSAAVADDEVNNEDGDGWDFDDF